MNRTEAIQHLQAMLEAAEQQAGPSIMMEIETGEEGRGTRIRLVGRRGPWGRIVSVKELRGMTGFCVLAQFDCEAVARFCRESIEMLQGENNG
jgi:hypothetical protein